MPYEEEKSPLSIAFGVVLKEQLEQPGFSAMQVHRDTGIARTSLYAWLRGTGDPSLSRVWSVAAALGLRPSELLKKVERQLNLQSTVKG